MLLVNARHHRPRWCLPPSLLDHIERALTAVREDLSRDDRVVLEHQARLVRAGQAPPQPLLARIEALRAG
ncbi:MAG: hypothetical protein R3A79_19195 [Nannocystaceae bacterium]